MQLHGNEAEPQIARIANNRHIIKGMRFDPAQVRRWDQVQHVNALLIDGPSGGGGEGFDHRALADMMRSISKPVILAGGLTTATVGEAIRTVGPYGVDVSSGVETSRGVKDSTMIREFCAAVREADNASAFAAQA